MAEISSLCVLPSIVACRCLRPGRRPRAAATPRYLATWSILIQFMMCLIMPVFTNKTYQADSLDGSQKVPFA